MSGTIRLPAPVARVGDTVEVLNYRMRREVWERGEVLVITYKQTSPRHGFWLSYDVLLERRSAKGQVMRLYTQQVRALPVQRGDRCQPA